MFSVTDLLFRRNVECSGNFHNEHFSLELEYIDLKDLFILLNNIYSHKENKHKIKLELFTEKKDSDSFFSCNIYLVDYWKEGEHSSNHLDQLFLGISKIDSSLSFENIKKEIFLFFKNNNKNFLLSLNC